MISSLERDGRPVFRDLRWGVYVTFAADSEYVRRCFHEYGLVTDASGNYAAMYKPYHLIGLELGISVASRRRCAREATGAPTGFRGDVVATAKRDLKAGEMLDGEGGYTVYGKLMPAADSLACGGLPIGLAHGVALKRAVAKGHNRHVDATSRRSTATRRAFGVRWNACSRPNRQAPRARRASAGLNRAWSDATSSASARPAPRLASTLRSRRICDRASTRAPGSSMQSRQPLRAASACRSTAITSFTIRSPPRRASCSISASRRSRR